MRISTTTLSRLCSLALGIAFASIPLLAADQPSPSPGPAPVPAQIFTAKKVFIANAGAGDTLPSWVFKRPEDANEIYNRFYAAMKKWGRFELVSNPSDADLVFELRFINAFGIIPRRFGLKIWDARTRFILWTFVEDVTSGWPKKIWDKDCDEGMAKLVSDVMSLAAQPANPAAGANQ